MDYYRNYLLMVAVLAPTLGLVAKLTAQLFGADIRYLTAVASTFAGYCFVILSGLISGVLTDAALSAPVRLLIGFCAMVLAHTLFLRSRDKERVGFPMAAVVAVAQLATGSGIAYAVDSALAR